MRLRDDTRASAGSGFNFLLVLVAGGLMGLVLRYMVLPIMEMAREQTNSDVALQGISYTETVVAYFGLAVLAIGAFYLIVGAILDRRFGV